MDKVFVKGFVLILVLFWVDADEVSRIDLPIHSCAGCGGRKLSVRLETGTDSCSTTIIDSFSRGRELSWSGRQLGNCQQFTVDSSTRIRLHTDHRNQYAVQGTMTIHTNSHPYYVNIPTSWRGVGDNVVAWRAMVDKTDENAAINEGDEVRQIYLPIYSCTRCGGSKLSVRLETAKDSCSTTVIDSFSSGEELSWSGSQLGNCQQFSVDGSTSIQLHTDQSTDQYAVQGTLTIHTNLHPYHVNIPTSWRGVGDNAKTYAVNEGATGCNGGDDCCISDDESKCGEGEGDCDGDEDCQPGLFCGQDNCMGFGPSFERSDDCCTKKPSRCDGMDNCCGLGGYKCKEGEGDCDRDSDCQLGLVCGKDNCLTASQRWLSATTFEPTDDCCVKPS